MPQGWKVRVRSTLGEDLCQLRIRNANSTVHHDVALVHAAKLGDAAAFGELVSRHSALVFRVVRHIVPSNEDAEDVMQDAFLSAFEHLHQFQERARFSTWVSRIAYHAALSKIQHLRRFPVIPIHDGVDEISVPEERVAERRPNPEQMFSNDELKGILQQALASLSEGHRLVFVLRDIECMSVSDTAATLLISTANVKVRLFRARLQLRQLLSEHFGRHAKPVLSALPWKHLGDPAEIAGESETSNHDPATRDRRDGWVGTKFLTGRLQASL